MHVLVVYDSKFGNTARIAEAITRGAASAGSARLADTVAAGSLADRPDLVVIGGPTQRRGASPALRAFVDALPATLSGLPTAVFDTRYRGARLVMGSASGEAAKHLTRAGSRLVVPPESFYVGRSGPAELQVLEEGELERAEAWGRAICVAAGRAVEAVP